MRFTRLQILGLATLLLPFTGALLTKTVKYSRAEENKNSVPSSPGVINKGAPQKDLAETAFYPAPIVLVDDYFSHHILIAEKKTHRFYLFAHTNGIPKLIKSYNMATGKKAGDKWSEGDHRTPQGVYFFSQFIPNEQLLKRFGKEGKIYGAGAFVMDFPNSIDKKLGKTGSGIWLHSTNDETRIDLGLDSRGCVVTANQDLKDISQFIELEKTPIIIVEELLYLPASQWLKRQQEAKKIIEDWAKHWQEENFEEYISFYHPKEFFGGTKNNFQSFKSYKKAVFSNPGKPSVSILYPTILASEQSYWRAKFLQDYKATTIKDIGVKTLYLRPDDSNEMKIIYEGFEQWKGDESELNAFSFSPSMRFFTN